MIIKTTLLFKFATIYIWAWIRRDKMTYVNESNKHREKRISKTIKDIMDEITNKEIKRQHDELKEDFILSFKTQKELKDL